MPREEKISVKLVKDQASFDAMKSEAKALQNLFGSIKIGNIAQAEKKQAAAAKEAANATMAQAKANKELQNAEIAKQKAIQAGIETENKRIKQQKEAANTEAAVQNAAKKGLQTRSAALRLAAQENAVIEKQEKAIAKLNSANVKLGKYVGIVEQEYSRSIKSMRDYITSFTGMENATVKATGAIHNSQGTIQTYSASIRNADGTIQKFKYSVDENTGKVYQLDQGVRSASSGMGAFANSVSNAGKSLLSSMKSLVGFYGVTQSLRYAFREMKSMSDEMIIYQKVTKSTSAEMEEVRRQSYESAKRYGQSPTDFLSAASEMARAGYRENAVAMADLAVKTKLVGDITAEEASKFLLAVDAGYKYQGNIEKLSNVLDMANEVGNQYATSVGKISEGMTLVASLSAQANVPIEQLIAALGTLTAATQRSGSEMARALRFIMLGVLGDTVSEVEEGVTVTAEQVDSMTKALQHYAPEVVNAAKATGKLINPMEAIGALAKAYKEGLIGSQEELFSISKEIAGQRYYNAFAALIENFDTMYQSMLETEREAAGSAQKEVDVLIQSWSTKLQNLKTTWVEMVDKSITEGFIKDLIDGATAALQFAGSFENLAMMAGGAYTAIKSVSAAAKSFSSIRGVLQNGGMVSFGSAFTATSQIAMAALSAGVSIMGAIRAAQEAEIKRLVEAAEKSVEKAVESFDKNEKIQRILARYDEIMQDGVQTNNGELEELQSLQAELNRLVGGQADAIDLVNGAYDITKQKLQEIAEMQEDIANDQLLVAEQQTIIAFNAAKKTHNLSSPLSLDGLPPAMMDYIKSNQYLKYGGITAHLFNNEIDYGNPLAVTDQETLLGIIEAAKALDELIEMGANLNEEGDQREHGQSNWLFTHPLEAQTLSAMKNEIDPIVSQAKILYNILYPSQNGGTPEEPAGGSDNGGGSGGSPSNDASGEVDEVTDSWDRLTISIRNANTAAIAFNETIKSTKADSMNQYAEAYKTWMNEIKEGRVNSTAFYASARMLLGEEAFAETGGISANVLNAMNRILPGAVANIATAERILNTTYEDNNGRVIEGWGIYELLKQTPGYSDRLIDDRGYAYIPNLSEEDINNISRIWSGLNPDVIVSALNAFDQYDINGRTTSDVETAMASGEDAAVQGLESVGEAARLAAEELYRVAGVNRANARGNGIEMLNADNGNASSQESAASELESAAEATQEAAEGLNRAAIASREDTHIWQARMNTFLNGQWNGIDANGRDLTGTYFWRLYDDISSDPRLQSSEEISHYLKEEGLDVVKAFVDAQGDATVALQQLGMTWNDIKDRFNLTEGNGTDVNLAGWLQSWISNVMGVRELTITLHADTDEALDEVQDAVDEINESHAEINVGAKVNKNPIASAFNKFGSIFGVSFLASGSSNFAGGPAVVNDGKGPELIVDGGRAFIAGGGKPSIVSLNRGAKIFNAKQTMDILGRSGIPAYAGGTSGSNNALQEWIESIRTGILGSSVHARQEDDGSNNGQSTNASTTGSNGGGSNEPTIDKESYEKLKNIIDYILNRIDGALNDQLEVIDNQIEQLQEERKMMEQQNELEKKQEAVAKAQQDLQNAMNDRTVRYLGEDGKWHWMADARNVQSAQETLKKAEDDLAKYKDEVAFNARIKELEDQKKELQGMFTEIRETWEEIVDAVNTPVEDINELLDNILKSGTPTEKKAAEFTQRLLLNGMLPNGVFSGNYQEALTNISNAAKGNPVMPGEATQTLASLIAAGYAAMSGKSGLDDMMMSSAGVNPLLERRDAVYSSGAVSYNYYIEGVQIGAEEANKPLSEILNTLTVYANPAAG